MNTVRETWCTFLDELYHEVLPNQSARLADAADAVDVLDAYALLLTGAPLDVVRDEVTPFLRKKIRDRAVDGGMFASPVVLVVYWLVRHHYSQTLDGWTSPRWKRDLEQVASDLGKA